KSPTTDTPRAEGAQTANRVPATPSRCSGWAPRISKRRRWSPRPSRWRSKSVGTSMLTERLLVPRIIVQVGPAALPLDQGQDPLERGGDPARAVVQLVGQLIKGLVESEGPQQPAGGLPVRRQERRAVGRGQILPQEGGRDPGLPGRSPGGQVVEDLRRPIARE